MLSLDALPKVTDAVRHRGRLTRIVGLQVAAMGIKAAIGDYCMIYKRTGHIRGEVVGFSGDEVFLLPVGSSEGLRPGDWVEPLPPSEGWPVGFELIGRVLDSQGEPLDGGVQVRASELLSLTPVKINPTQRKPVVRPLDVGVRTINACATLGRGQRVGLMASSGLGKSVLMGMMSRFTDADVVVVALIGERGREVQEFLANNLGVDGLKKAVVIVSPGDDPALMRINAARYATRLAGWYRDQGKQVLMLMDSLSRYAQALREVGLAVGEPAVNQGYPPSVFAKIPEIVEQAGNSESRGTMTAIYTLLDEHNGERDAVIESAKAILDGHIVLSRSLAEQGVYPAIDLERSISRVMRQVSADDQVIAARELIALISIYRQKRDLVLIGAYEAGTDAKLDRALALYPAIEAFMKQDQREPIERELAVSQLLQMMQQ